MHDREPPPAAERLRSRCAARAASGGACTRCGRGGARPARRVSRSRRAAARSRVGAEPALDRLREDRVEHVVGGQVVAVELVRRELGRRRLLDRARGNPLAARGSRGARARRRRACRRRRARRARRPCRRRACSSRPRARSCCRSRARAGPRRSRPPSGSRRGSAPGCSAARGRSRRARRRARGTRRGRRRRSARMSTHAHLDAEAARRARARPRRCAPTRTGSASRRRAPARGRAPATARCAVTAESIAAREPDHRAGRQALLAGSSRGCRARAPVSSCAVAVGLGHGIERARRLGAGRSTTSNAGVEERQRGVHAARARRATNEPPSKISSSLPPTWFTNAIGTRWRARELARSCARRSRALPTCHGEPTGSARARRPPRASSPTGSTA